MNQEKTELNGRIFSEDQYYEGYKRIRNKFRKYNSVSVLRKCIEYLHHPTVDRLEALQKQPWFVMLLMKWVLIDDQFDQNRKKEIDNKTTHELIQSVFDLSTVARLPNDFDHHSLFMRGMAYQQFMYQEKFSFSNFARQQLLFAELQPNNYIQKIFSEKIGLEIKKFLELCLALLTRFIATEHRKITKHWFSTLECEYTPIEVEKCLNALSLPILSIRKILRQNDSGKRHSEEVYEQTPFVRFPLIKNSSDYLCINHNVLFRSLEHFVYDLLKEVDSQGFMSKFGTIYEKYVGKIIDYSGCSFLTESDIKKAAINPRKIVDYVVIEKAANIFIDAKAVEMTYKGKVTHSANIIKGKVKVSVLKAIEQAQDVLDQIRTGNLKHDQLTLQDLNYLIVVTYKEFYLGRGENFYENIAKEKIDEICDKYPDSPKIMPENMFFITIQEFEYLMEYVRSDASSISDCFEIIKKNDANPKTSKFAFTQHLWEWKATMAPSFVTEKAAETFSKFETLLS
ncbi:MAG: hypothetical protein KQH59_03555 [Desulfobulbaceae bacterium]|nr:hypothetical protein [Desulfobulbaceae bacterium]